MEFLMILPLAGRGDVGAPSVVLMLVWTRNSAEVYRGLPVNRS